MTLSNTDVTERCNKKFSVLQRQPGEPLRLSDRCSREPCSYIITDTRNSPFTGRRTRTAAEATRVAVIQHGAITGGRRDAANSSLDTHTHTHTRTHRKVRSQNILCLNTNSATAFFGFIIKLYAFRYSYLLAPDQTALHDCSVLPNRCC